MASLKEARRQVGAWALRPILRRQAMKFPSFSTEAHDAIAGRPDYFRHATLGLSVQRVEDERVPGAFAEVGVYRGETSAFVHSLAPRRRLYLFDTFSGFDPATGDERFRDTSLEAVRRRVGNSGEVVTRAGYVPDSFDGLEGERFAWVLLDLDHHAPTVASLEFFYPRLAPGGYLIVHDYNSPESEWACKRALDTFLEDKPERLIDIGDVWGSALMRKA
jgi:O-methyltransferase